MAVTIRQIYSLLVTVLVTGSGFAHEGHHSAGSRTSPVHDPHAHHLCDDGHDHDHDHDHHHHDDHSLAVEKRLPEELAEEEDLKLFGFGSHHHDHGDYHEHDHNGSELYGFGGIGQLIVALTLSGFYFNTFDRDNKAQEQNTGTHEGTCQLKFLMAGAMLGDAFLHQLPHAFGGGHSHSHDHHADHASLAHSEHEHSHSHSHSLKDLSVGLSVLAGIVAFLLVEKVVRYVEEMSGGVNAWSHGHHHHHRKNSDKLKDDNDAHYTLQGLACSGKDKSISKSEDMSERACDDGLNGEDSSERVPGECLNGEEQSEAVLRKRHIASGGEDKLDPDATIGSTKSINSMVEKGPARSSNLVFGYLNLFSDGVHNFTDGMALGSAFLLYGSIGGWSRTLFLLAHELPQEIGDFGILVRSGFSVSKAIFFNFLSALVALAGTALALIWGQDPGQSSLIEGFTAGGFIYIAVAGVLAEMNNGTSALRTTAIQLISLTLGMGVALCISLVE
ncbi:hypothetical protein RJ640_010115 [Escallonia rubra]|uniref:IAA-alanine resistance protein 1 n=1 Tax=Escallonia rubra TaxID=112253 RepID=A0AA88RC36_9ASTE|nr:hypothetical protein RJ640_010115 [Escallonia rubra]